MSGIVLNLSCKKCTLSPHRHEEPYWRCQTCGQTLKTTDIIQQLIEAAVRAEDWKKRALRAETALEDKRDARVFANRLRWGGKGPSHMMKYRFR